MEQKAKELQSIFDNLMAHETRPPNQRGVGEKPNKPSRIKIKKVGVTTTDVFQTDPTDGGLMYDAKHPLFSTISINDINQNQLSDCYLLALLASLANTEKGRAFIPSFIFVDSADASRVIVVYQRNGLLTKVHCDLLVAPIQNRFDADADLWVSLVEKTYSLYRRGMDTFASINFGYSSAVASDLGMLPATIINLSTSIFDTIRTHLNNQNALTFGTPASPGLGLVGSHEYTICAINADNSVVCRNPWGQGFPPIYTTIAPADFKLGNVSYVELGTTPTVTPIIKGLMINLTSTTNIPIDSQSSFSGCQIETGFGFKDWGYVDAINGASISYDLNVQTAGTYGLTLGVASNGVNAGMDILANGVNVGSLQFSSAGWQTFINKTVNIALPAGAVSLKMKSQIPTQYNLKSIAIGPAVTASDLDILKAKVASAVSLMNQAIQALG